MDLALPTPSSWLTGGPGRGRAAFVAGGADPKRPDLRIDWSPLILLPDEQRRWIQGEMSAGVPPTARVQVTGDSTVETRTGWPVRLVEATVVPAGGGDPLEWRLGAFYAFFEHAATAMVRGTDGERFQRELPGLREILLEARPDWSDEVAALVPLWDVEATGARSRSSLLEAGPRLKIVPPPAHDHPPAAAGEPASEPRTREDELLRAAMQARGDEGALGEVLEAVDRAIGEEASAALHHLRGQILSSLDRGPEALAAFRAATDLDPERTGARHSAGLLLAADGREEEAIAEWEAAAAGDRHDVDCLYNVGLARYRRGEFEAAREAWRRALERAPEDFWISRKLIQAEFALERYEEAAKTRERILELWRTTRDPAVELADEYVFDQFEVAGRAVHAHETLRPKNPSSYSIYTFRVVDRDGRPTGLSVQMETSDYAKERGVPFVLSILHGSRYKALGTSDKMPPYPELKATVSTLIRTALGADSERS